MNFFRLEQDLGLNPLAFRRIVDRYPTGAIYAARTADRTLYLFLERPTATQCRDMQDEYAALTGSGATVVRFRNLYPEAVMRWSQRPARTWWERIGAKFGRQYGELTSNELEVLGELR